MALSESEKRLLAQMEAALAAEDPKLVNSFRGIQSGRRLHQRRATLAGLGFLAGIGLLIGGMLTWPGLSVIGFLVMVACAVVGLYAWQPTADAGADGTDADSPKKNPAQHVGHSEGRIDFGPGFMDRMEERWRRRRDEEL